MWSELNAPPALMAIAVDAIDTVVRRLPQVVGIVIAEGVPEPVKLSAHGFDVLLGGGSTVLRILDQTCPRSGV